MNRLENNYILFNYYLLQIHLFQTTKKNPIINNRFIFINSWHKNGNYLEYNKEYAYASINSFYKSIFNKSFHKNKSNLD